MMRPGNPPERFDPLDELLVENILNLSDEQLLAEVVEEFGDRTALATEFDAIVLREKSSTNVRPANENLLAPANKTGEWKPLSEYARFLQRSLARSAYVFVSNRAYALTSSAFALLLLVAVVAMRSQQEIGVRRFPPESGVALSTPCEDSSGDEAIAACGRVLALNPNDAAAYTHRGSAYNVKGEYDLAISDFDRAIRLDPTLAGPHNGRGYAYYLKGDFERAFADADKAIRLDPKLAAAYNNRGNIYRVKGDYNSSISDYDQAIRLAEELRENWPARLPTSDNMPSRTSGNSRSSERELLGKQLAKLKEEEARIKGKISESELQLLTFIQDSRSDERGTGRQAQRDRKLDQAMAALPQRSQTPSPQESKPTGPLPTDPPQTAQGPITSQPPVVRADPIRIAIQHGPLQKNTGIFIVSQPEIGSGLPEDFSAIEKGKAPFILSQPVDADIVWDVVNGWVLLRDGSWSRMKLMVSRDHRILEKVDGAALGGVIDRTWAAREIRAQAVTRLIKVNISDVGLAYALGEQPTLTVDGVRDSYLTAVNLAADGTIQLLLPSAQVSKDQWTFSLRAGLPLGTNTAVVIATSTPAEDLVGWLRAHDQQRDAFELPAALASKISADGKTRLGTIIFQTIR
jgi:tetratricopeptide (TPR) repeat protein